MSQIILLQTSLRSPAFSLRSKTLSRRFGYGGVSTFAGARLYASKVKPMTQVQVRRVSEVNPVSSDLRKRYLKDLIVTIEQLHKTKLSEHSSKTSRSEGNSSRSHASSTSSSRLHPDSTLPPSSWTSSIESFSRQLRQFQAVPETPIVQLPGNILAGKTVNAGTVALGEKQIPSTNLSLVSHGDLVKKSKPLGRATKKSRTTGARSDLRNLEATNALLSESGIKCLDLNSVAEDFDGVSQLHDYTISDGLMDQNGVLLNEITPTSSLVLDEHDVIANNLENADAHYDIAGSHEILPKTRKRSRKQKTEEDMSTNSRTVRSKGMPVWSREDFKNPDSLKIILDRVASILRPDKKSLIEQAKELELEAKEAIYLEELSSYVDLCIQTNMLKNAQWLLTTGYLHGKTKGKKKLLRGIRPVHDISVYNKLMRAWAKQGNLEAIRKLFLQFEGLDLKPSFLSFAICLECLGRQDVVSHDVISHVIQDVKNAGFELENVFIECNFVEEDKEFVLKAIRQIHPDFVPNARSIQTDYVCPLLVDLNANNELTTNPFHGVISLDRLTKKAAQQIEIEMTDHVIVDSVQPSPVLTASVLAARESLTKAKEKWRTAVKRAFITSRQHVQAYSAKDSSTSLFPYLKLWSVDVYVDLMMKEVEMLGQDMAVYSPSCTILHYRLGEKLYRRFIVQSRIRSKYVEKVQLLYKEYGKRYNGESVRQNHREMWMDVMSRLKLDNYTLDETVLWPSSVTKALGKFLYDIIMAEVKVDVPSKKISEETDKRTGPRPKTEIPAFFTVYRMRNGIPSEEVLPHPFLVRLYSDASLTQLTFEPGDMPSLVPPIPWFAHNCGGSLLNTTDLIRNPRFSTKQCKIIASLPSQSLYPMFDGLNVVSACPWKINKKVLDVIIEVFNRGGDAKISIPERVDLSAELPKVLPTMTLEERLKVLRNNQLMTKERKEAYSQWCTELYRLSIAQKYRDEVFWFPHNMDFRGRVYPTPPHFNHLGSDVARSILAFGQGKPLGADGLNWLKIHLVNLTGFKKRRSNKERLTYANEVMTEILDSADRPLTGQLWWQKSDEPWQTLACCVEIANAVRSSDPEKFVSHIPVHQDGSCNGLQHYAALGRDESGASSVNLNPFDTPQDVYSDAVELVEKRRVLDSSNGIEIAKLLDGFVQRKVIKQTIMTTVYGVTKYGARNQIGGHLRHIDEFPKQLIFPAMIYLTDKTFDSLQQMFTSTKEIQDWFVLCSDIISRLRQQPVEWVTPLGLPILQPYFKTNRISDKKIGSAIYEKPNSYKQKNAFPPNFIHSLDSAHMMLTAIHCLRTGILFASVHDCFWTHACDIPKMNKICREQFVGLHTEPILEDLAKYLVEKFGFSQDSLLSEDSDKRQAKEFVNYVLANVPDRGTFDIRKVIDSTYFFS